MATTTTTSRSTRRALVERQHEQAQAREQAQKAGRHAQAQPQAAQHRRSMRNYSAPTATAQYAHVADTATEHTTRPRRRNSARMKRPLDFINPNPDPTKVKRSRIAVEIKTLSKQVEPPSPPRSIVVRAPPPAPAVDVTPQQNKPPPFLPSPATTTITTTTAAAEPAPQLNTAHPPLTTHQKKAINGIRHELDRLQSSVADAGLVKEPGRKLRSQEATRFKSELSAYFPDYDEVIGNDSKEHHTLNVETPILIVYTATSPQHNGRALHPRKATATSQHKPTAKVNTSQSQRRNPWSSSSENYTVKHYGDELYTNLYEAQRIDLPVLESRWNDEDPLPDSLYETAHKRAERLEKSIRNTEKGRAQHEKDQIIRILGDLQGPDWLRTMGVNGVTESKKKTFEAARNHFIKGCQAILEKFRWWTQEEKKRKLQRDRLMAEEAASAEQGDEEEVEDDEDEIADSEEDEEMFDAASESGDIADDSDGDPPDSSDVDAHIAKQLHEEALARVKRAASTSHDAGRKEPSPLPMPQPPREFRSFFEKRYERDAALSRPRRSRRVAMAWGHTLPETLDEEFYLSEEYRDDDLMQARERRKRRDRRGSRR